MKEYFHAPACETPTGNILKSDCKYSNALLNSESFALDSFDALRKSNVFIAPSLRSVS